MSEADLRARLHREMLSVRDGLDRIGPLDGLDNDGLSRAEETFAEIVAQLAEMNLVLAALRGHPSLSVEGALVAGAAETALVVIRSTLGTIQAGFDDERDRRAA